MILKGMSMKAIEGIRGIAGKLVLDIKNKLIID